MRNLMMSVSNKIAMFNNLSVANNKAASTRRDDQLPIKQIRNCAYRNDYNMTEISKLVRKSNQHQQASPVSSVYRNNYNYNEVARLSRAITGWGDRTTCQSPSFMKLS